MLFPLELKPSCSVPLPHQGDAPAAPAPQLLLPLLLPQLLWELGGTAAANWPSCPTSPQGAGGPRELVQLDVAAGKESGCKDVPPMEPPLPVTGSTQHLSAQLWDTNTCPRGPQSLFEQGTCFKCKCFLDWEAWEQ